MTGTYCARCNKPLKGDEAEPIDNAAPTGAGTTIYVCRDYGQCKPVPTQTTPYSRRH